MCVCTWKNTSYILRCLFTISDVCSPSTEEQGNGVSISHNKLIHSYNNNFLCNNELARSFWLFNRLYMRLYLRCYSGWHCVVLNKEEASDRSYLAVPVTSWTIGHYRRNFEHRAAPEWAPHGSLVLIYICMSLHKRFSSASPSRVETLL